MARHCPPLTIDFASDRHPRPESLRTGDLLFPRCAARQFAEMGARSLAGSLSAEELALPLPQFLGPALTLQLLEGEAAPRAFAERATAQERSERRGGGGLSPERVALLVAILKLEFAELFDQWFDMSVSRFLSHPLARVLLNALDGELADGFFIGHCAMVLREHDGRHSDDPQASLWVIEANATSFSRYGVSARPYHIAGDEVDDSGRHRSWLGQRAARGDSVWRARPAVLETGDASQALAIRERLVPAAKRYQHRSYSFFDSPQFANDGRLYCSEFVFRVLQDVRTALAPNDQPADTDDRRRWAWMRDNNPPGSPIGKAIAEALNDAKLRRYLFPPEGDPDYHPQGRPFFILTVQMLWRSAHLLHLDKPGGVEYDAP